MALALGSSIAATALALALIFFLQRSFHLVRQLAFPLYIAAIAAGLKIFTLFEAGAFPLLEQALGWILLFLPAVAALRLIGLYLFEIHLQVRRGIRLPPLMPAVALGVAYILTALITLQMAYPQLEMTGLLATSAITSLVLGLALQPILGNFFAGVVISLEKPFRINDWIRVGAVEGRVEKITWRTTYLRTRENDNLVLPNAKIADEQVVNFYSPHPLHMERIYVGVHYRTPPYRVRRALLDCVQGVEGTLEKPTPEVYLLSFDDSSMQYELRVWIDDFANAPRIASEIRMRIWEEFKRSGITIPFPIRTLEIAPRPRRAELEAGAPQPARLFVTDGAERGRTLELDGGPITVGRAPSCQLVLTERQASKEHLRIEWTADGYLLTDLESSVGTRVNGAATQRHLLGDLDRITIGTTTIVFETHA
ncbi:MAG TPA: mechanosensitive ion channel domain-containing protein [Acidobacteriota bacterium]